MNIVDEIARAWGWVGFWPVEIVGENDFGNLMVKDSDGRYWRLCPEDLYCKIVATDQTELDKLSTNQEFLQDWYMTGLVEKAKEKFGPLSVGRKYCLKIPGAMGGEYGGDNLATISLEELIRASGHLASQIREWPDGSKVRLKIID
jgi:hypothetical protein